MQTDIGFARLQIRFTRFGRKKVPFYRIIAIDSRSRRDGLPIEVRKAGGMHGWLHDAVLSRSCGRLSSILPPFA